MVEAFNKLLEHALTKVCNVVHDGWDKGILVVLWEYLTPSKQLTRHAPFRLVYGKEVFDAYVVHSSKSTHCATHVHVGGGCATN
jgi:hypothetical protein